VLDLEVYAVLVRVTEHLVDVHVLVERALGDPRMLFRPDRDLESSWASRVSTYAAKMCAGVVDQPMNATEALDGGLDHVRQRVVVGHVRGDGEKPPAITDRTGGLLNGDLIEAMVQCACEAGREIATPAEARAAMNLPSGAC
jgi:hypothetical protein